MTERYLEDFAAGQTFGSGRLRVEEERIKTFAAEFDPQPFHLDEEAARGSIFRGLAASGWHTAAMTMRLLAEDGFEQPLEFGLRCQDGTCRWFLWHRHFDSEHQAIFIAGYDITEQKGRDIASSLRSCEGPKRADAAT